MKAVRKEFKSATLSSKRKAPRHKTTRNCPSVTLRLSPDDHERLKELAGSMALSTYVRAKALGLDLPRRIPRSTGSVVDKQAIAQILGLLGQLRIANNLNQLAYHANVGSLTMEEENVAQISEAYEYIAFMRKTLIVAPGLKQ